MKNTQEFYDLEDPTFEPMTNALQQAQTQADWLNNQVIIKNDVSSNLTEEHYLKDASVEGLKSQSEDRGPSL